MSIDDLLLALKDIQPPPEPGWWPLAPGWWIVLLCLVPLVCALLLYLRQRRSRRIFEKASRELGIISGIYAKTRNNQLLMASLSRWLRQVSILAFPERQIAAISGQAWLEFLDEVMPAHEFSAGEGKAFAREVYRAQPAVDANSILALCKQWLAALKPCLLERGRSRK